VLQLKSGKSDWLLDPRFKKQGYILHSLWGWFEMLYIVSAMRERYECCKKCATKTGLETRTTHKEHHIQHLLVLTAAAANFHYERF
jgi:hypothetical protein